MCAIALVATIVIGAAGPAGAAPGDVIIADAGVNAVFRMDKTSGASTPVTR